MCFYVTIALFGSMGIGFFGWLMVLEHRLDVKFWEDRTKWMATKPPRPAAPLWKWTTTKKRVTKERLPCPVRWPDCSPDGCAKCDGKGYTEKEVVH